MSSIRYEVADRVATITIDRPEKRNAMTYQMVGAFTEAIWRASDDDEARVVVITGSGGSFCAGTDLADLHDTPSGERISAAEVDDPRAAVPWPIVACPKPVIAAVDGPAVGMGVEYATMSDVRIATDRARFGWVFVRRGLVPDMGASGFLLPRIVGHTEALRLQLSGEMIDADEAAGIGFVSAVVPPDDLADAVRAEADRYLSSSPFAVARAKRLVYDAIGDLRPHLDRNTTALQECFKSEDHAEGVASFLERRPARFTGR